MLYCLVLVSAVCLRLGIGWVEFWFVLRFVTLIWVGLVVALWWVALLFVVCFDCLFVCG